jgi:putative DNA primase/helicase
LVDKPAAIISDARLGKGRDTATAVERLLSISGEDALTIDVKYKTPYTVKLPTRLIIMTNEVPALIDSSGALASRFLTLRLTESFLGREDPGLPNQLLTELPGILLWALQGRERLYERGRFVQPESGKTVIDDLVELSSPVTAFVEERCDLGPDQAVAIPDLFNAWNYWCEENNQPPGSKKAFVIALRAAYPHIEARRGSGEPRRREYVGVGLSNVR